MGGCGYLYVGVRGTLCDEGLSGVDMISLVEKW